MSKKFIFLTTFITLVSLVVIGLFFHYGDRIAMLNPKGLIALKQRDLMMIATVLMLIVIIPVFILTIAMAWEYRATNKEAKYTPEWDFNLTAESIWWGFPFAIVVLLSFVAWHSSHELDPYRPLEINEKSLKVQVVALQWKWLFLYPEHQIATLNFLQIPDQTPIDFEITADAPMNSFWIPELGGQIYAMPGMKTKLHLIADKTGDYLGSSANLSGQGFAGMTFTVKATDQKEFNQWVKTAKQTTTTLGLKEYIKLAEPSSYVPVATFLVEKEDLFDWIVMQPMRVPPHSPENLEKEGP